MGEDEEEATIPERMGEEEEEEAAAVAAAAATLEEPAVAAVPVEKQPEASKQTSLMSSVLISPLPEPTAQLRARRRVCV